MRCPGVISDAARAQGALHEAEALSDQALTAGAGLGFGRHNFAISGLRTVALLALERHDLAAAAEVNERILGMLGGGRPAFDYLAQLDGARIWAAGGKLDEALTSLPAARLALRSPHHVAKEWADRYAGVFDNGWDAYRVGSSPVRRNWAWSPPPPSCRATIRTCPSGSRSRPVP